MLAACNPELPYIVLQEDVFIHIGSSIMNPSLGPSPLKCNQRRALIDSIALST